MDIYDEAVQKLAKWRTLLTGWQLGTRAKGDPEGDAVRDHRESSLLLRAEVTALTRVMVERGVIDLEGFRRILAEEAEFLSASYERRFPGFRATPDGLVVDAVKARETMKGWKP